MSQGCRLVSVCPVVSVDFLFVIHHHSSLQLVPQRLFIPEMARAEGFKGRHHSSLGLLCNVIYNIKYSRPPLLFSLPLPGTLSFFATEAGTLSFSAPSREPREFAHSKEMTRMRFSIANKKASTWCHLRRQNVVIF